MPNSYKILFICICSLSWTALKSQQASTKLSFAEIDSLLEAAYYAYENTKALEYTQLGMEKAAAEFGEEDSTYAYYLNNEGLFYNRLGDRAKALKSYLKAKDIRAQVLGKNHPDYAGSLQNLAVVYEKEGRTQEAENYYDEALAITENTIGKETKDYVTILKNKANLYSRSGKLDEGELTYKKMLELTRKMEAPSKYADALNSLAVLYTDMGRYHEAEPLLLEAKEIRGKEVGEEHPIYAKSLNNLAQLYTQQQRFNLAEDFYKSALAIASKWEEKKSDYALYSNNLGLLYMGQDIYPKAAKFLLKAQKIYAELYGEADYDYIVTSSNLATLEANKKNYPEAIRILEKMEEIVRTKYGETNSTYTAITNNLALNYEYVGNFKAAEKSYKKILDIQKKAGLSKGYYYIDFLNNLAGFSASQDQLEEAWTYSLEALELLSGRKVKRDISSNWASTLANFNQEGQGGIVSMLETLSNIYNILEIEENQVAQKIIVDLALKLLEEAVEETILQADQLSLLKLSDKWISRGIQLLSKEDVALAIKLVEKNKSLLLLQFLREEQGFALGNLPKILRIEQKELVAKQSNLKAALTENRSEVEQDSLRKLLNEVNAEVKSFKQAIRKDFPNYAALQYQGNGLDLKQIQSTLDTETAVLDYWVADSSLHIFYIDQQEIKWLIQSVSKTELETKVENFRNSLTNYSGLKEQAEGLKALYLKEAKAFYQLLLAPIEKELNRKSKLVIIPDGSLFQIPFEALLVNAKGDDYATYHYLLQDFSCSYQYALRFLLNTDRPKRTVQQKVLAFAAEYKGEAMDVRANRLPIYERQRRVLQALPAVKTEVEGLEELLAGTYFYGQAANEANFKAKAKDYAVIHLAMHGLLNAQQPLLSALAFTEDGDSLENNFLQAYEITQMELNAELVVLSACETGYGRFETGNAVASLGRAFMYAGAPAMVVSLWQVNDVSTSRIMQNFYKELNLGKNKDEALRQAKLDYLKSADDLAAHPAFWSPFILIGDEKALVLQSKGQYPYLYWILGGIFVLIVAFYLYRRRAKG